MALRIFRYCVLIIISLIIGGGISHARHKDVPAAFGSVNTGRDFWVAVPANWNQPGSTQHYIRLYITSSVRTSVKIWAGGTLRHIVVTIPNDVVTFDLNPAEAQMFTRSNTDPVPDDRIYRKKAIHITSDAPIAVSAVNRTSRTGEGMLLLPTNALGRQYIVASYGPAPGALEGLPSQFLITAPYGNTQVTVKQPAASPNHPEGSTVSFVLDGGDVYSAMSASGDMSGAEITATKPVAVTAGNTCADIPDRVDPGSCNHIEEMMLPVESWGKVYHGVSFETRKNGDIWRIYASQPDTKLYLNGTPFATLAVVGGGPGEGWLEYRAVGRGLNEWTADKPIYVAQYNTSQHDDAVESAPFFMTLNPLEQYQTSALFTTPSNDFPRNFINLVTDSAGFHELEMTPAGTENWERIEIYPGTGEVKKFATMIGGRRYVGVTIDLKPGTYRMRGKNPFTGYLYGFSDHGSYGYPLSVLTDNLLSRDTSAPTLTRTQDRDGTVRAVATDQPDDAAIRTNIATIEMDPDSSSNYQFVPDYFEAGVDRTAGYTLTVIDRSRPARAVVSISDAAGNTTIDRAEYNAPMLLLSPSPLEYGPLGPGEEQTRNVTITNTGSTEVNIQEVLLQKGNAGFVVVVPGGGFVLGPAGSPTSSMQAEVKFTALARGVAEDSLGVRIGSTAIYLGMVHARVGSAVITVSDIDFGRVPVGTYREFPITIANTAGAGGDMLIVTGVTGLTTPEFTLPDGMPALPFNLLPQTSRTIIVRFTPAAARSHSDRIIFTSNAVSGDSISELRAEGIQPSVIATSNLWAAQRVGSAPRRDSIYLKNTGSIPATIVGLGGITGDATDFTIINPADVAGRTLAPGDSVMIYVDFAPTAVGTRHARATWEVSPQQADPPSSELVGVGIEPSSGVSEETGGMSGERLSLEQNMPNPVSGETTIGYSLVTGGQTMLRLYDARGAVVRTLMEGYRAPGRYEVRLDASGLAPGSYYYTLTSGGMSRTRTLTIVR